MLITSPPPSMTDTRCSIRSRSSTTPPLTIAIHGGAGTISTDMPPALQAAYRERLRVSLRAGWAVLDAGGNALDAVCASVKVLEDSPLFNAGKGAVFTVGGKVECEASVMLSAPLHQGETASGLPSVVHSNDWFERGCPTDELPVPPAKGEKARLAGLNPEMVNDQGFDTTGIPSTRRGAAVTLVGQTKNPILLARTLYLQPTEAPHVLLSGTEAEKIGWRHGTIKVDSCFHWTRKRWLEHRRGLGLPDDDDVYEAPPPYAPERVAAPLDHPDQAIFEQYKSHIQNRPSHDQEQDDFLELPKGTVGACAIDAEGRLAVATSTGGKTNKSDGRLGDTPSIGAGFWAERFARQDRSEPTDIEGDVSPGCFSSFMSLFGGRVGKTDIVSRQFSKINGLPASTGLAVSGTGDGDYFLRVSFASLVAHRIRFLNESAEVAGQRAVDELGANDGVGGAVVLDHTGRVTFPMNSNTMNRGVMSNRDGTPRPRVALFQHEGLKG